MIFPALAPATFTTATSSSAAPGEVHCKAQSLGFNVEVHKLVDSRTKARVAQVDLVGNEIVVVEKQMVIGV